jgi:hypothetical protein
MGIDLKDVVSVSVNPDVRVRRRKFDRDWKLKHEDSRDCWCAPRFDSIDPISGREVWEHFDNDEAN